ncbi:MAG: hypothetical protein EBQ66_06475 [Flavobacteriia bacterium]|nr:hypothetical protein [Flavobacteriia bacterium]
MYFSACPGRVCFNKRIHQCRSFKCDNGCNHTLRQGYRESVSKRRKRYANKNQKTFHGKTILFPMVDFCCRVWRGTPCFAHPCMFPMIPMTVTFFTKQSKTRTQGIIKALVYGASIVIIYVTSGILFTAVLGTTGLNDLATNIWMNLVFFTIFMVFAFSFLGAFEIQLPSSWVNKMDKQADRGGYIGVFFMAFTLGLVSFSCTGPIIGSLLVTASTTGSYLTPAIGMGGFALALAIPFTLFAIFPKLAQFLTSVRRLVKFR